MIDSDLLIICGLIKFVFDLLDAKIVPSQDLKGALIRG